MHHKDKMRPSISWMAAFPRLWEIPAWPFIEDERTSDYKNLASPGLDNIADALPLVGFRLWRKRRRYHHAATRGLPSHHYEIFRCGDHCDGRYDHADLQPV
jgi:hypothetical protein